MKQFSVAASLPLSSARAPTADQIRVAMRGALSSVPSQPFVWVGPAPRVVRSYQLADGRPAGVMLTVLWPAQLRPLASDATADPAALRAFENASLPAALESVRRKMAQLLGPGAVVNAFDHNPAEDGAVAAWASGAAAESPTRDAPAGATRTAPARRAPGATATAEPDMVISLEEAEAAARAESSSSSGGGKALLALGVLAVVGIGFAATASTSRARSGARPRRSRR